MTRRVLLLVLLLFACGVSLAHADGPISLDDYRAVVARTFDLADQATRATSDQRATLLNQAADALASVHEIQLDATTTIAVNNDDLVAELRRAARTNAPVDATNARDHVRALRDALATLPVAANESERAKLRDILNNPPFAKNNADDFITQLLNIIADWLDSLQRTSGASVWNARDLITAGAAGVVVIVLVVLFVNLRLQSAVEEILPPTDAGGEATTSAQAFDNAQQFASAGDYRSAIRQLYLATLLLLDEKGKLRYDRSLTNREYVRALANDPPTSTALAPIVETFDRVWYGFDPVNAQQFETYKKEVDEIQKLQVNR